MSEKQLNISENNVVAMPPVDHDKRILSRLQLFRNVDLEDPAFDALLGQCAYRELEDGDSLLSVDKENHFLYVVIRGRCAVQLGYYDEMPLAKIGRASCRERV